MAPLVTTSGKRAAFKSGSVIPVKVVITGCDGSLPQTLTPVVKVTQSSVDGAVVDLQSVANAPATAGINMRWATDKYMYNFSTKNSNAAGFVGQTLPAGDYYISLTNVVLKNGGPAPLKIGIRK